MAPKKFFGRELTPGEKVELKRAFKDEYGLNKVLAALGLSKGTWSYAQAKRSYEEKYSRLRRPLLEIARAHPEYGYRRTNAGSGTGESRSTGRWSPDFMRPGISL